MAVLTEPNSIGASLGLLSDEWTLLIVRGAFEGDRRYGDWKARLPISDAVLTARLATLVDADVLRRAPSGSGSSRLEYELTASGLDLWQLLLCIWDWERRHAEGQSARLPQMVHTTCGATFHPVLRCAACVTAVTVADVAARFGPSGGFERSIPVGRFRRRPSTSRTTVARARRVPVGPGLFADTMAIIGSRWSTAVLGAAFLGASRFRDFEQIGAPPAIVSDRLRSFLDVGVLAATGGDDGEQPAYRLTAKGAAFFPVVVSFVAWGERWRPSPDGPAVVATHRACGAAFVPELACSVCAAAVTRRTLQIASAATDR